MPSQTMVPTFFLCGMSVIKHVDEKLNGFIPRKMWTKHLFNTVIFNANERRRDGAS